MTYRGFLECSPWTGFPSSNVTTIARECQTPGPHKGALYVLPGSYLDYRSVLHGQSRMHIHVRAAKPPSGKELTVGRQKRLAQITGLGRAEVQAARTSVQAACTSPLPDFSRAPTGGRWGQHINPPPLSLKQLRCKIWQEKKGSPRSWLG